MTTVFCSACGAQAGDDVRFCPECGTTVDAPPSQQAGDARRPGLRRWLSRRALMVAIPLAAVLAGAAIAASLVMGGAPEDHAVDLVPPDVAFYGTAHLDPSLGQKRAAKGVLDRAEEAGAQGATTESLEDAVEETVGDWGGVSYERDVKPYLGNQIAMYVRAGGSPTLLVSTTDGQASLETMRRVLEEEFDSDYHRIVQDAHRGQPYEHVTYDDGGGAPSGATAFTILDGFVVIGAEDDIRASIDARAGESLAASPRFAAARGGLSDDVLAAAYYDPDPLVDAARSDEYRSSSEVATLEAMADGGPVAATLVAHDDRLALDLAMSASSGDAQPLRNSSALLETLPAEAIVAISLGEVGEPLGEALAGGSGEIVEGLREVLDELAGLEAGADLASWLGQVGLYVADGDPDTVQGALVAETRSPGDSDRVLSQIESYNATSDYDEYGYGTSVYASDDGLGFDVAEDGDVLQVRGDEDRVVAGMGAAGFSADRALDAAGGFGSSPLYRRATQALGGGYEPFLAIDAPPLQGLLEQAADAAYDETYMEDVRPWLSTVSTVAGGVSARDDAIHLRLVADLGPGTTR